MITNAVLHLFFGVADFVAGLMPTWSPPSLSTYLDSLSSPDASSSLGGTVFGGVAWFNFYFPVDLLADLLTGWLVVQGGMVVYKLVVSVLTKMHLLGGAG